MATSDTGIEWTDRTWNPVRGCDPVSPGCANCYAATVAARFGGPGQPYEGLAVRKPGQPAKWTGVIRTVDDALTLPLSWRKPARVFVNSMSDLFHKDVPDDFIDRVFAAMIACDLFENRTTHQFQILTKRADRMAAYFAPGPVEMLKRWGKAGDGWMIVGDGDGLWFSELLECRVRYRTDERNVILEDKPWGFLDQYWPLPFVWLGVSVENQAAADERIPHLLRTPAAVRFLSCEPLLGPVDLTRIPCPGYPGVKFDATINRGKGSWGTGAAVSWVIVGGESGPGARPMHPAWARSVRDQCQAAGVAFFFKQWGAWTPWPMDDWNEKDRQWFGDDAAGFEMFRHGHLAKKYDPRRYRLLDGRTWDEFPAPAGE